VHILFARSLASGIVDLRHSRYPKSQKRTGAPLREVAGTGRISGMSAAAPPAPGLDPAIAARLKRDANGLFAAVAQQWNTGEVLMVGWMDDEALHRTLTTGRATYFSRSRQEYWAKGDTSGHRQWVRSVALDCDGDAVLVRVDQEGPACHTGTRTCFDADVLPAVEGAP
jgi:phosphoribosyl-AMP cyclohydrolase